MAMMKRHCMEAVLVEDPDTGSVANQGVARVVRNVWTKLDKSVAVWQ